MVINNYIANTLGYPYLIQTNAINITSDVIRKLYIDVIIEPRCVCNRCVLKIFDINHFHTHTQAKKDDKRMTQIEVIFAEYDSCDLIFDNYTGLFNGAALGSA